MISKWTIFSFVYLDFVRIRIRIQIQIIIRCFTTFNVFVTEKSGRKINGIYRDTKWKCTGWLLIEIFRCKINRFRFDFSVRTYCTPAPKVTRHKNKCKQVFRCEYDNERASLNHRKLLTVVGMRFCVLLARNMQNCAVS